MLEIESAGQFRCPAEVENDYREHLSVPALSVGTYSVRRGAADDQVPHGQDEVYVVMSGRGRLQAGEQVCDVRPGSVLFVAAGEEHRFVDVEEDLALLVLFAPAYQSPGSA